MISGGARLPNVLIRGWPHAPKAPGLATLSFLSPGHPPVPAGPHLACHHLLAPFLPGTDRGGPEDPGPPGGNPIAGTIGAGKGRRDRPDLQGPGPAHRYPSDGDPALRPGPGRF